MQDKGSILRTDVKNGKHCLNLRNATNITFAKDP